MSISLKKWGNSLGVRIPKKIVDEIHLKLDSELKISVVNGKIILEPIRPTKLSLEALVAGITEENCHKEIDTGLPLGNEVI